MKKINLYLLDDHKIVRDGLRAIFAFDASFAVVGEGTMPEEFFQQAPDLTIDILLLDISFPKVSGMDVLKEVKRLYPQIAVVILSMHDNPEYILRCLRDGAASYLPKDIQAEELIKALKEVKAKGSYYPEKINFNLSEDLSHSDNGQSELLTPKEREVLELMAQGLSSKEMATKLGISARTIDTHRLNIMKKLGTSNSAETTALASRLNLLDKYRIVR